MKNLDLITSNYKDQSKLLEFALDNSADPVFWADWNARIIYANKKATSLLRYSREELFQLTIHDIDIQFPKEDWPNRFNKLKKSSYLTIVSKYRCKDGSTIPVEISGNYLRFKNKDYICIAFRDQTEHLKIEEELRECGEKYHSIFDNVRDGIAIIDANDGHILDCNLQFKKQFDRDGKELRQLKIWEISPPDKIATAKNRFIEICEKGYGNYVDLEHQKPDGSITLIDLWAKIIELDGRPVIISIARDMTEFRGIKAKLEELNKRMIWFFNEANDGLAVVDISKGIPNAVYSEVNDILCKWLGYTHEEMSQMGPSDLATPKCLKNMIKQIRPLEKEPTERAKFEVEFMTKDKCKINLELNLHIVQDKGYAFAIYRDVTDRKVMERKNRKRYQKERELRRQLESQVSKRIEFTRSLIHELKTPLTPLIGASEMLTESLKGSNLERAAKNIYKGALSLNNRVDDLVDLVKGEMGLLRLHPSLTDIPYLLQGCIEYVTPLATRKKQTINLDVDDTIPKIKIDQERILEVIQNILGNAIRYTQTNGSITVSAKNKKDMIAIEISDTGCGIPKEYHKFIFEPFSSEKKSKLNPSGLGIGLPLSKMIVDLHHGSIDLDSSRGQGSIFTINLPLDINNNEGAED